MPSRSERSYSYYHRLHRPADFRKFFQGSEVLRLKTGLIFRIPNGREHFRLGFTIKCRGSAVQRNAVKRSVREVFRLHAEQAGTFDYNLVLPDRLKLDLAGRKQFVEEVERAFAKQWTHFQPSRPARPR